MKAVRFFSLFITLVLAVSTFATPAVAKPAAEPAILAASDKIEADLLDALAAEGSADFIVDFVEQADLSPAYSMGWDQRGEFVYDTLRAVAAESQAEAKAMLDGAGLSYQTFIAGNELYVWSGTRLAADALAALPEVDAIRATRTYQVDPIIEQEAPAAPDTLAWGISYTHADQFWAAFGLQGDGIKVANIDTGVQYDHPALDQSFACPGDPGNPACWEDPSAICPGGTACDNNGHGTHTMGTMVADDDPALTYQAGMAPNATWIACKGCETNSCSDYALNTCADWILAPGGDPDNRPHVVNNSWGGGGCDAWYLGKVDAWRAAGTFPAFSAGNNAPGCSTLGSPGDYQESFASAAIDAAGNVASFSSRGPSCYGHEPYTKPNISAPGVSVCSSVPGDGWSCGYSGTSMASPHTAGAVALLWSCNPSLVGQMDTTFEALQNTASAAPAGDCSAPPDGEGNYTYGYGYLDILAAGMAYCGEVDMGYLDGYVYDVESGDPIEGATVSAVPAAPGALGASPDATTGPDGYYTMTLVVGTYDVTAFKTNYTPEEVTGIEIFTDTVTSQDFYLQYLGSWTELPMTCFDFTRFDAEFFPGDDMLYILGGRSGDLTVGDIYQFDPSTGACADTGANMPNPISNYTVNLVNDGTDDLLCTFGGRQGDGTQTLDVQCYNPATNSASVVTTLPAAWTGYVPGAQAVVDNQVYIFGGFNPATAPYMTARTDQYDPVSNTFTQVGDLSLARSYLFAGVVDGVIYAFGGDTFDGANLVAQTKAEKMDPLVGTWDDAGVADLPTASGEGQTFAFDSSAPFDLAGQIIMAGGGQWPAETNAALSYDVAMDTYNTEFPDLVNARRNQAGAFVPLCTPANDDGLPGLWVFGGRQGVDTPPYMPPEFYPLTCALEEPPVASFEAEPTEGCAPLEVSFTDTSSGIVEGWFWDFGDGIGTSDQPDPTYPYDSPGTYTVTLTVTNTWGSDSATGLITVFEPPVAAFSWTPTMIYTDTVVQFMDQSTGDVTSWLWDFGDGGDSDVQNPIHAYAMTGTYLVSLTVADANMCSDMIEHELTVTERPISFTIYLPVTLRNN